STAAASSGPVSSEAAAVGRRTVGRIRGRTACMCRACQPDPVGRRSPPANVEKSVSALADRCEPRALRLEPLLRLADLLRVARLLGGLELLLELGDGVLELAGESFGALLACWVRADPVVLLQLADV